MIDLEMCYNVKVTSSRTILCLKSCYLGFSCFAYSLVFLCFNMIVLSDYSYEMMMEIVLL